MLLTPGTQSNLDQLAGGHISWSGVILSNPVPEDAHFL
jgi:hypothetical protein